MGREARGRTFGQVGSQRMLGLRIVDECDERLNDLIGLGSRLPVLGVYDWQAYLTLLVDLGMIDFGLERDLWWLEWIFSCKETQR